MPHPPMSLFTSLLLVAASVGYAQIVDNILPDYRPQVGHISL